MPGTSPLPSLLRPAQQAALALTLLGAVLRPPALRSQGEASWSLRVDNDYLNFWQPARDRPDGDYTQGFRYSAAIPIRPDGFWARLAGRPSCRKQPDDCAWQTLELEQEIYTPSAFTRSLPVRRPYAGWLAVSAGIARRDRRRLEALQLTLGVTGPPSLGGFLQTQTHRLFGFSDPAGWDDQLPTELGAVLEYRRTQELVRTLASSGWGARAGGLLDARLGTTVTDWSIGTFGTFGLNPMIGQFGNLTERLGDVTVQLAGEARLGWVLRNEFLQGTLFRTSAGVTPTPLVGEVRGGVGVRVRHFAIDWWVVHRGREYAAQPLPHTYSSLGVAFLH